MLSDEEVNTGKYPFIITAKENVKSNYVLPNMLQVHMKELATLKAVTLQTLVNSMDTRPN